MSATLTFTLGHQRKITYLHHGADLADVVTYAGDLHSYTRARISRATVTLQQPLTLAESSGDYASTDLFAKLFIYDPLNEKHYNVIIPAPISTMFEEVSGRGWRVKADAGAQITSYYATLSGLTLEFREGWLCGHR